MNTIIITLSKDLVNKQPDKIGMARWFRADVTPSQFREHVIGGGGAFAVGVYANNKRKDSNFISSCVIGLDFDDGKHTLKGLLNHPFISKYAGLIYASPSHTPENPKWRVVFFLSSPIDNKDRYIDYVARLLSHISKDLGGLDCVAKDSARLFFGHKMPLSDEGVRWYENNTRLPLEVLAALPPTHGAKKRARVAVSVVNSAETHTSPIPHVMSNAQFVALVNNLPPQAKQSLKNLLTTTKGRNTTLYQTARTFNDCLVSSAQAYQILHRACLANGYIAKDGLEAFYSTFSSAYKNAPAPHPTNKTKRDEDISYLNKLAVSDEFSTAPNVIKIAYPYVTQMTRDELNLVLSHRLVMVKSPTGTGKSTLQKNIIDFWAERLGFAPRVLVITHRRALVREIAKKNKFITYEEISNPALKCVDMRADSNVTTFDSLWRYKDGTKFDLVMIDEAVQALEHLASSSTLRNDRITPLSVLINLMGNARQTLAFDANFSDSAGRWLESVLSAHTHSSIRLVNITRPQSRLLDIWHDRSAFLNEVFTSARAGFTTLACVSVRDARLVNRLASDWGIRTLLVCSDNASNHDVKEKIANINTLTDIDLLIYSPSLGTGIDITRPVNGAFLMARPRPLSGDDCVQMLSRARHALAYGAFGVMMGSSEEYSPLTPNEIFIDLLQMTRATLGDLPDNENGDYLNSARLYATLQADKERQFFDNNAFVKSALANGFTFRMSYARGHNEGIEKAFKQALSDDKQWRKDTTLSISPLSDEDIENLRKNGNMSYSAKMANLRWHIEYMTNTTITEKLYDALDTTEKRLRVNRLADVLARDDEIKTSDLETNLGRAYQDVTPSYVQRSLMLELITLMGYSSITDLQSLQGVTRDELITPALEDWFARNAKLIRQTFGRYRQTDNSLTELRAFLRSYGVKLTSHQVRRGDEFVMVYSISPSNLNEILDLAHTVLRARRACRHTCVKRVKNAETPSTAKFTHTQPHTRHAGGESVCVWGVPLTSTTHTT